MLSVVPHTGENTTITLGSECLSDVTSVCFQLNSNHLKMICLWIDDRKWIKTCHVFWIMHIFCRWELLSWAMRQAVPKDRAVVLQKWESKLWMWHIKCIQLVIYEIIKSFTECWLCILCAQVILGILCLFYLLAIFLTNKWKNFVIMVSILQPVFWFI